MEETGGVPDIIDVTETDFIFGDCSEESPQGRRNLNYDEAAKMAAEMGVEIMDEATYRKMQESGKFDRQTFSWLLTDAITRKAGGALRGFRRDVGVGVNELDADFSDPDLGWRASLRVKKV